jgi:two-component system response regulator HydG
MAAEKAPRAGALAPVRSLIDALPEPRIVLDASYRIVHANPAYCREYGTGTPVVGRRCYEVSHHIDVPCDQAGEACPLKASQKAGAPQRVLHLHHTPRGEEHVDVETTPIADGRGRIVWFVETLKTVRHARSQVAAHGLVGRAPAFKQMLELVVRAAPTDIAVLLLGETGTGKELVARAIHEASRRASGPFVAVDCAGLTETLFESELFGYEKGAFTGANFRKMGLVESAAGGTLFLDEIGDMPLAQQVKLLRLLETGTFRRVGSVETLPADFRLVSATHRDLEAMVQEGSFRRDLYFRISAFPVHTPALWERPEDVPLLAESLLARVAPRAGLRLSPAAQDVLSRLPFPGNIRELRNVVERASVLATGPEILPEHLPSAARDRGDTPAPAPGTPASGDEIVPLEVAEQRYVRWAAKRLGADRRMLAERLGISERTLFRKLRQR